MKMFSRVSIGAIAGTLLFAAAPMVSAQSADKSAAPGKGIVALYHVAPGKQLEMLKWFAAREAIDKEAGVAPTQWYVHTDGDSWDFMSISPQLTEAEDAKVGELAKKKGLKTGFAGGLEFRQFVTSHTDTFVRGPMSASDLIKDATGR